MLHSGQIIGRYVVEHTIGSGGMATVYKVQHRTLGSEHAMKVMVSGTRSVRDRMMQEGRVQANLRHPNVVAVTDVTELGDAPILVMEFVDGPDLHTYITEHGRLELGSAIHLFRGIVRGVRAAHLAGIVHRDLKPANILLATTPHGIMPKIADFGLVKVVVELTESDGPITRAGAAMGTPEFMAPEQIRDASTVDSRADMFSLGCLLYYLVCGRPPFAQKTMVKVFNAVLAGKYRTAGEVMPGMPTAIDEIIAALLQVNVDKRVQDCDTLMGMLGRDDLLIATGSPHLHPTNALAAARAMSDETWDSAGLHSISLHSIDAPKRLPLSSVLLLAPLAAALIGGTVTIRATAAQNSSASEVTPTLEEEPLDPTQIEVEPPSEEPVLHKAPEPEPTPAAAPDTEAKPAAAPPSRPAHKSTATVSLDGDASRVWLVREGQRHRVPAEIPPGHYEIIALYPQQEPKSAGTITVMAGLEVMLRCTSQRDSCSQE